MILWPHGDISTCVILRISLILHSASMDNETEVVETLLSPPPQHLAELPPFLQLLKLGRDFSL